jgi:hypothetical protein
MRAENEPFRCRSFEAACADHDVEHRLTKPMPLGPMVRSSE